MRPKTIVAAVSPNCDSGYYAVWATGNYRITFGWEGEDAMNVDLEDCH